MGKSLDYIKYRVLEQKNTNLDIAFDNAFEVSPKQFLKFDENNHLSLVWKNDDADPKLDTIVKGNIADVAKKEKRMAASNEQVKNNTIECGDLSAIGSKKQGKDISRFLIDDEL